MDTMVEKYWNQQYHSCCSQELKSSTGTFQVFDLMTKLVVQLISCILLGPELANDKEFVDQICQFQQLALKIIETPPKFAKKMEAELRQIRRKGMEAIQRHAEALDDFNNQSSSTEATRPNYWRSLVDSHWESTGRSPSRKWAAEMVFSLVFAAIANTNASATWTLQDILLRSVRSSFAHM